MNKEYYTLTCKEKQLEIYINITEKKLYIYIYSGAVHLKLTLKLTPETYLKYCISTILQLKIKNKRAIQNIKNKCITF